MRRTEFPQGFDGQMRVATFVWDAVEDGPLPVGTHYMRGEVPAGSIIVGGFTNFATVFGGEGSHTTWVINGQSLSDASGAAAGWYATYLSSFADPTKNILIRTDVASRMQMNVDTTTLTSGRVVHYLFYVSNELGLHGQIARPDASQVA